MDFLIAGRVGISIIWKTIALCFHLFCSTSKETDDLLFAVTYSQHFLSQFYLFFSGDVDVHSSKSFIDGYLVLFEGYSLHLSLVLLHILLLKLACERDIVFYLYLLCLRSLFLFFSFLFLALFWWGKWGRVIFQIFLSIKIEQFLLCETWCS